MQCWVISPLRNRARSLDLLVKRVIEQTIRETLPEGFQRAEYLLEHGMVDMVVNRHELRDTLVRIVDMLMSSDGYRQN